MNLVIRVGRTIDYVVAQRISGVVGVGHMIVDVYLQNISMNGLRVTGLYRGRLVSTTLVDARIFFYWACQVYFQEYADNLPSGLKEQSDALIWEFV